MGGVKHVYADADVKCPYFMEQGTLYVKCEGMTPQGSMAVNFKRGDEKISWVCVFCNSIKGSERCPLRKMKEAIEAG